jgi:hypothetical protein
MGTVLLMLLGAVALVGAGCEVPLPQESGEGPEHRAQHVGLMPEQELALAFVFILVFMTITALVGLRARP